MKKLFRFKYEPCNGTCYAYDDIFYENLKTLDNLSRLDLVKLVVEAHDRLCDNPDYFFGIDQCEKTGLYIGHFKQPNRLDMFSGKTLDECIRELCNYVVKTNIPKVKGQCNFGESGHENLANIILEACA